jgi:hypothetical protein
MTEALTAWAVLDMGGGALHSVHIFKEDADKAAFGLGSVVPLICVVDEKTASRVELYLKHRSDFLDLTDFQPELLDHFEDLDALLDEIAERNG